MNPLNDSPGYIYEIRVAGHLAERWSDWFEELTIQKEANGETTLRGLLIDQAALFGVLNKVQALNLTLLSVKRVSSQETCRKGRSACE